jgi:hypothetical protein
MKEAELRLLFDNGIFKAATICRHPMADSWMLKFDRKKGLPVFMDSQRISPRAFKTLDAAFQAAHDIGFQEVAVVRGYG